MRAETGAGPARPPVRRDGTEGFTILEVLVALTVLGLVVAVLFEGIASGLRRARYDEGRLALVLQAEQVLQRIDLDLAGDRPSQSGAEGDLRWRLERIPVQDAPRSPFPPGAGDEAAAEDEEGELLLVRYVVTVEDAEGRKLAVETKRLRTARTSDAPDRPRFGEPDSGSEESGPSDFTLPEPGGGFDEGEIDATP